jgi:rhodanese-related sulfurtransferase
MRLGFFILFVFVLVIGLWACTGQKKRDDFVSLDSSKFATLLKENADIQLLDVRTEAEYAEVHIKGSKNINLFDPDFAARVEKELDPKYPVAVYCKSGRRSLNAAGILVEKGFKVYNLDKGINGWIYNGMPIEY